MTLTEKHRPETLDQIYGQPHIPALKGFLKAPYPVAFLLHGPTGTGKTTAALALARGLGIDPDGGDWAGFVEIPSGDMGADSVRELAKRLRIRPMSGNSRGWKVCVVNECDRMSAAAECLWLDVLEHIPAKTVIVFTTNHPNRLTDRLMHRCLGIPFLEPSREQLELFLGDLCAREGVNAALPEGCKSYREAVKQVEFEVLAMEGMGTC